MNEKRFDVCVVGAGVMGSSTARCLAKLGKKILLLEQFPLPHWRGSSHGQTRIIRCIDPKPHLVKMANDSLTLWKEIEQEAGERMLVENVGILEVEEPPGNTLKMEEKYLIKENIDYEFLSNKDLKDKFPGLEYGSGYSGIYEKSAGILLADKCLRHLQTVQAPVFYWKVKTPGAYDFTKFPTLYDASPSGNYIYGIPSYEYPDLIKLGPAGKAQEGKTPSSDPDMRDHSRKTTEKAMAEAKDYVKRHVPLVDGTNPAIIELCMYTLSFDRNFVIDKHPLHKNVIIASGFSGQGFKHAPVVGKILADLALGQTPSYDISDFCIEKYLELKTKSAL